MQGVAKLARGEGNVGLLEVADPVATPGHVVIQVKAAGICGTDLHIYHDEYPSHPPVIMGHEVAGTVAAVGDGVTRCRPGDRVTAETYFYVCGQCPFCRAGQANQCPQRRSIGSGVHGGFAPYVLVPERNIHGLPANIDDLAGSLSEPVACCVHALEETRVEPGETAIVSGPGAIGLIMAQVAKAAGATVVLLGTGADEERLALGEALGIDLALNVQALDVGARIREMTDGLGADVVFECAGVQASAQSCLDLVRRRGRYAQVGLFGRPITWDLEQVAFREIQVSGSFAHVPSAWRKGLKMMETGQVKTAPLVTSVFPLSEWQPAFDLFERREGVKVVFTP